MRCMLMSNRVPSYLHQTLKEECPPVHYWIIYYACQALGHPRPQGLEGKINSPIMYWRAFFILFHHFIDKLYVHFGDLSCFTFSVLKGIMSQMYVSKCLPHILSWRSEFSSFFWSFEKKIMEIRALVLDKWDILARGHNTKFYNALWHQWA